MWPGRPDEAAGARLPEHRDVDIVATMRAQHVTLRDHFDATLDAARSARGSAWHSLVRYLAMHETAEDLMVHQGLLGGGGRTAAVAEVCQVQERRLFESLTTMDGLDPTSDRFIRDVDRLKLDVESHAAAEERLVIPTLAQLSPTQHAVLTSAFAAAELAAPLARPPADRWTATDLHRSVVDGVRAALGQWDPP